MIWISLAVSILQFIVWILNKTKGIMRRRKDRTTIEGAEHDIRVTIGRLRERIRNRIEQRRQDGV